MKSGEEKEPAAGRQKKQNQRQTATHQPQITKRTRNSVNLYTFGLFRQLNELSSYNNRDHSHYKLALIHEISGKKPKLAAKRNQRQKNHPP
jgi:hypothetical protein